MSAARRVMPSERKIIKLFVGDSVEINGVRVSNEYAWKSARGLVADGVVYVHRGPRSFTVSMRPPANYGVRK